MAIFTATVRRPNEKNGDLFFSAESEPELRAQLLEYVEGEAEWMLEEAELEEFQALLVAGEEKGAIDFFFEKNEDLSLE